MHEEIAYVEVLPKKDRVVKKGAHELANWKCFTQKPLDDSDPAVGMLFFI